MIFTIRIKGQRTAYFIARKLKVCGLNQARAFVRAAIEEGQS